MMEGRVWHSEFPRSAQNIKEIEYSTSYDELAYIHEYNARQSAPRDHAPDYMYFGRYNFSEKKKSSLRDLFTIRGGLMVVSERFRDLLLGSDLGKTDFFELPLYEYNQKDRRPGRYFILHIAETKDALRLENCGDLSGKAERLAGNYARLRLIDRDTVVAVDRQTALAGVDLWGDPMLPGVAFMSDRLKLAIEEAKIQASFLQIKETKLVEDTP